MHQENLILIKTVIRDHADDLLHESEPHLYALAAANYTAFEQRIIDYCTKHNCGVQEAIDAVESQLSEVQVHEQHDNLYDRDDDDDEYAVLGGFNDRDDDDDDLYASSPIL